MITLLAGDPVYGARVLNDLLESYLNHRAKVEKFPGATNFFDEQISNVQNRLRELEENLSNFQQKEKIIDYNNEITRVSENLRIYEQALANIKIQLIHLKQNYKEQDPQIKNLISEERALALVIQDLKNQAETLPQKIKIINILKRDIANEASTLANLVQKKNQEMVSENKDRRLENVKLITLPTYSIKKEKPKRGTNMVLGAFLGLFAGLGLALLREYHDQSFNNEEEISQYLGLPVLGKIEEIQKTKRFADLK
jgi:tyrosine-protein kinase Etk/Wzc